jgi:hypothetical protein
MRRSAAVLLLLVVIAGLAGTGIAQGAPKPAPVASAADVASLKSEVAQLQRLVQTLRQQVGILQKAPSPYPTLPPVNYESRVSELEDQVGVNSIYRSSITNLWAEVASMKRSLGSDFGGSGLESRVRSLESCVQRLRSSWSSNYAPYC